MRKIKGLIYLIIAIVGCIVIGKYKFDWLFPRMAWHASDLLHNQESSGLVPDYFKRKYWFEK